MGNQCWSFKLAAPNISQRFNKLGDPTNMNAFVAVAALAIAVPLACATFTIDGGSSIFPFITLGSTTSTSTGAASGLAITGLSASSAALAGVGGLLLAIKAGGALGLLAAAATRRGKRSIVSEEEIGEQFVFDAIAAMDNQDCGKRYLCEIAATPVEQLTQEELTSLLLFQSAPGAPGSTKAEFDESVRLGAISRNIQTCYVRYSSCPRVSSFQPTSNQI